MEQRRDCILIVDDDVEIRTLLHDYLERNGYRCVSVADGTGMLATLDRQAIDLIVLDVMLPGHDGLTLCRDLRTRSDVPVIMLTARGEDTDRIIGLEMGADDYLSKPFNPRELLARVKVILRRARGAMRVRASDEPQRIRFASWKLDLTTRNLVSPNGVVIALSGAEFRLLKVFLERPNRVLNRDQLMELTQGQGADALDRSIDVLVSRVRQRLDEDAREPRIIKTVRGEGYVLASPVAYE
ncbi:MAG: response regulator [Burkholderiales bacterium]|nr:response regulator [Burkholderiales bacterium]